jgi:hypothetical protein
MCIMPQEDLLAQQRAASLAARQVDAQTQVRVHMTSVRHVQPTRLDGETDAP